MRRFYRMLILAPFAAIGCGGSAAPEVAAQNPATPTPPATAPAAIITPALPVGTKAEGGKYASVKGKIVWAGDVPKLMAIDVKAEKECCKDGDLMPTDVEIDPKSKGIKNVVVWLRPDTDDRKDPFPADKIKPELQKPKSVHHVIDQPKCQFEPRALAARAGDTLEVKNSAKIPHNVNYSSDIESINPIIPAGGTVKLKNPLAFQSTPIMIKCDIHGWMQGRVRVFDHPYYATTDKDGNFEIKDAPAGKWRLVVWHENGFHKGREGILGTPIELTGTTMEVKPIEYVFPK